MCGSPTTRRPTNQPSTEYPTEYPTIQPTYSPITEEPSSVPTKEPSKSPTASPTALEICGNGDVAVRAAQSLITEGGIVNLTFQASMADFDSIAISAGNCNLKNGTVGSWETIYVYGMCANFVLCLLYTSPGPRD